MKRKHRALEEASSHLKAENHRLESEGTKQQRRIDQLLNLSDGAKNIGMTSEIRRDIEKSILVRQLKNQINNLRSDFADKEAELDVLRRNIKSTHLAEVENERDEYYLEVQRLKSALLDVKEELQRERQRREWNTRVAGDASDDLRKEVARLSSGYQSMLTNISNRSRPSSSTGMRPSSGPESPNVHHNRPVSATAGSNSGKDMAASERQKRPQSASATTRSTPLSTYFQPEGSAPIATIAAFHDPLDNFGMPGSAATIDSKFSHSDLHAYLDQAPTANSVVADLGIFKVGERVEAQYQGGADWYLGKVAVYNSDGSYGVRYDDGDYESSVPLSCVRAVDLAADQVPTKMPSLVPTLAPAPASHPALMGGSGALAGTPGKPKPPAAVTTAGAPYKCGDKIEALYYKGSTWYGGKIQTIHAVAVGEFVYDVAYDDGDRELKVPEGNVRRVGATATAAAPSVQKETPPISTPAPVKDLPPPNAALFKIGDKVEGLYGGGPSWYEGKVGKVNPLNSSGQYTYLLDYSDGDRETAVLEVNVRLVDVPAPAPAFVESPSSTGGGHPRFTKGMRVQGFFPDVSSWYDGTVLDRNSDGTYHIVYDDGDVDHAAPEGDLRALVAGAVSPVPGTPPPLTTAATSAVAALAAKFTAGDRVEGRFGGGDDWYPAVISAVNLTGGSFVYSLDYDDGDNESDICEAFVRLLKSSSPRDTISTTAAPSSSGPAADNQRKPSVVDTNLDSFLNDLSDDDDSQGGGAGSDGDGGLDSGRGVTLRPAVGADDAGPSASIERAGTEDDGDGYDEDFDA